MIRIRPDSPVAARLAARGITGSPVVGERLPATEPAPAHRPRPSRGLTPILTMPTRRPLLARHRPAMAM